MKYKVIDLENHKVDEIVGEINFKNKLNDEIIDVSMCQVQGSYRYKEDLDGFMFKLNISLEITQLSCISLKPIKVLVDFDTDLFYTFKVTDDDSFLIIGKEIELDNEIWGEIMLHMPTRVMGEDEEYEPTDYYELEKENPFKALSLEDEED